MKRFCFLLLFAMTAVVSAAAKPAATLAAKPAETAKPAAATTASPAGTVLTSIYTANRAPSEFADQEKAADLLKRRAELAQKLQNERKRIMKEDAKAKELYDEIMRLNRQLASLLEAKKSMIELNSQLLELDSAISKLKPAPPPETESKDTKNEDADKTGKVDKADKTGKE
ncbi:MAG: hypothetical protein IKC53_03095 [Lentisphaeria bacterium]|nr:hypothetical protein [Lentisphaeria bacterium]